jgi:hypothetical protein
LWADELESLVEPEPLAEPRDERRLKSEDPDVLVESPLLPPVLPPVNKLARFPKSLAS